MYGTIRMHQERDFPGRVVGTELKNPDFAAFAKAFGGHGERVERRRSSPRPLSAPRLGPAGDPALHNRSAGAHPGRHSGHHPRTGNSEERNRAMTELPVNHFKRAIKSGR